MMRSIRSLCRTGPLSLQVSWQSWSAARGYVFESYLDIMKTNADRWGKLWVRKNVIKAFGLDDWACLVGLVSYEQHWQDCRSARLLVLMA